MLDTHGIIGVTRLTQARQIDAARALLYHISARSIGLCESSQPHSAIERAFCVPSEANVTKQCPACQKEFTVKPYRIDQAVYCSWSCYAAQNKVTKQCPICHKEFTVKRTSADRRVCCSQSCSVVHRQVTMRGANNPNYRGGKAQKAPAAKRPKKEKPYRQINFLDQCGFRWCECIKCGKRFQFNHSTKKYCPKCRPSGECHRRCPVCKAAFVTNSNRQKFCGRRCFSVSLGERQRGARSHRWKGGKMRPDALLRGSMEYSDWRKAVYARDDYTCQLCFERGGKIAAHHIREYAKHPDLRLVVENGITLCWLCHQSVKGKERVYETTFYDITGGIKR